MHWLCCLVWACVCRFVAGSGNDAQGEANRERLKEPCVCVTTFNMIAHKGKRSAYGEEVRLPAVVSALGFVALAVGRHVQPRGVLTPLGLFCAHSGCAVSEPAQAWDKLLAHQFDSCTAVATCLVFVCR